VHSRHYLEHPPRETRHIIDAIPDPTTDAESAYLEAGGLTRSVTVIAANRQTVQSAGKCDRDDIVEDGMAGRVCHPSV
jgi:hypothetical protein